MGRQHTSPAAPTTSTAALAQEGMWECISSTHHRGGPASPVLYDPTILTSPFTPPSEHAANGSLPCLPSPHTHTLPFMNDQCSSWFRKEDFLALYKTSVQPGEFSSYAFYANFTKMYLTIIALFSFQSIFFSLLACIGLSLYATRRTSHSFFQWPPLFSLTWIWTPRLQAKEPDQYHCTAFILTITVARHPSTSQHALSVCMAGRAANVSSSALIGIISLSLFNLYLWLCI